MLSTIFLIAFLALLFSAFWFSKTSKEVPKSWYEWKIEFRYQYVGIVGLIEDFIYRSQDQVGKWFPPHFRYLNKHFNQTCLMFTFQSFINSPAV